jgi:predicted HTH domain antitoxin
MQTIQTIDISLLVKKNIFNSLATSKEEFAKNVLYLSALLFYRKRKLSLNTAAELAGFSKLDFIEKPQQEKEYIFDYTKDEMDDIFLNTDNIK